MPTKIEWTNGEGLTGETWNPTTGCDKVSAGCKNCYAEREWRRLSANRTSVYYEREFTDVALHPERLEAVLNWKKPRRVFVDSMSDLFHSSIPFSFIDQVFAHMAVGSQHTFQVLTKRPERMLAWSKQAFATNPDVRCLSMYREDGNILADGYEDSPHHQWRWPLPNVWLGTSVEQQRYVRERCEPLIETPAAVHFASVEPMLEAIDFRVNWSHHELAGTHRPLIDDLDWIIAGGETTQKRGDARHTDDAWLRSLVSQCRNHEVPLFIKQRTVGGRKIEFEKWPMDLQVRQYPFQKGVA